MAEDPSIPEEILTAWKNAVQTKSKAAKGNLFSAFLKAGKNWGQLLGFTWICTNLMVLNRYTYSMIEILGAFPSNTPSTPAAASQATDQSFEEPC